MRRSRVLGFLVIVGLALVTAGEGCALNWLLPSDGLEATIDASEKKSLADEEIAKLREITKTTAEAQGLHSAEVPPYFYDTSEIYDVYERWRGPSGRKVILDVSKDRTRAKISIIDGNYVERDVRSDVQNVMDRVRERLEEALPDRPVKIEEVKASFWKP